MKWIRLRGKLYNAGHITCIEMWGEADAAKIKFSDGQNVQVSMAEYERLMQFCGGEQFEIAERPQKTE